MVRKTISISPESWEALASMGKFGMSFDDIIRILIEEHNELVRSKGESHRQVTLSPSASSKFEQSVDWKSKLPGKEKGKEKDRKLPPSTLGKTASIAKTMSSRDHNVRPDEE
jgi:hypothetical protein